MADRRGRAALVTAVALVLAGCAATPADPFDARGPITFVDGVDTSHGMALKALIRRWNADRGDAERVDFVEMPSATDEFRAQVRARGQDLALGDRVPLQPKCYDVMAMDVVWTAEFARAGYLVPLDPGEFQLDRFLDRQLETVRLDGRTWAIPWRADAGLLFYRKDLLDEIGAAPPGTWGELIEQARQVRSRYPQVDGYVGQLAQYEGLTVNAMEAVWATNGDVQVRDGRVVAEPAELRAGMELLAQGVRDGWIPRRALEFDEEGSREAFQRGSALFLRNWPYTYKRFADSPLAGQFGVTRLPGPSALGGWNLGVSSCSTHRKTARDFVRFLTGQSTQQQMTRDAGWAPTITALYDDPQLRRELPYLDALRESLLGSRNRPVTPNYEEVSDAIAEAFFNALAGAASGSTAADRLAERLGGLAPRR